MRLPSTIALLAAAASTSFTLAAAQDAEHWASVAAKSKDGIIKLDSASYEAILKGAPGQERDYSVVVELTAMGSQFKCQPCQVQGPRHGWSLEAGGIAHDNVRTAEVVSGPGGCYVVSPLQVAERSGALDVPAKTASHRYQNEVDWDTFPAGARPLDEWHAMIWDEADFHPSYQLVSTSWARQPADVRDSHFFASLDFEHGQAVYQRLGLSTAPTVQFHPAQTGSGKVGVVSFDLNRAGLHAGALHNFLKPHLAPFELYVPYNPLPLIFTALTLVFGSVAVYALWSSILPIIQSRFLWGAGSIVLILTFTSGHMWNRIKNAPYVAAAQNGGVSWVASGFQNQLGMESQVVGGLYGTLALSVVALTLLIPAQSSPAKQRVGVYVWLGILVVVFGLLMRLFRIKNGAYPFWILF